ncbi:hypothetical protein [Mesorhizobium sp. CAU 1741]|uniref:hypothetical protein n=1 Tax=Mesorhizobium sp. CAU 1741 TaxID=3140366 RepID=UPI00325AC71C
MGTALRYALVALVLGLGALLHASHALAFGSGDVAIVADILEELSPSRGEAIYYDGEAADDWYEFDAEQDGLIAAAGFSRETWREAYDNTLKGLIALIPPEEFEAIHDGLGERLSSIQGLSEDEKRAMVDDMRKLVDGLRALRSEGAAHADAVQPFAARLRNLANF